MSKPLLSISILVSNRIDTIRKCMESIKPLLTGFPCELIAVDTVGEATDGSIDVVREYTDKIYRFEWCNDFAKARNFGLEKCTGEWFMFIDDDEWFEDVSEIAEFFTSGEYKKYGSAYYKIRSYTNKKGNYSVASLFRMAKITEKTRFESRVHEFLTPLPEPAKEFSAYIHHYGYVFETEEEERAHCERNISLLEPDFKKNPWDMHVRMQLVQEYMFMKELWAKGTALCEDTLKADKKYYKTNEFQWILLSYVKVANKEENFEALVERAELIRKRFPLHSMANLAISTFEVNARFKLGQYEKGAAVFENALLRRKELLEHPEVKQYQLILDFETFLEDSVYSELLKFGIRIYNKLGNRKRAAELTKERFAYMSIPALTISVLVSNRKDTVRKCLESVKPLLEVVPSELIVVDTVGEENSDGSLYIAKEYTGHIVNFPWCDDFAAARNAGLKEAKGEWFLYLDDDEWFETVNEIADFFTSGDYLEYHSATYNVRNYKDLQGQTYNDVVVCRMVHRAKTTKFEGCINETFNNIYEPYKVLSAFVHHYGFAYATPEAKMDRMQYAYKLLEKGLECYPDCERNRKQYEAARSVWEKTASKKDVLLSVSLLVSNRKDTIRKCLESIKPLLQAVPSELILVDTVGEENSDGSLAIAKEYTNQIVRFEWCNDFAAARNAGLKQAKGKWFLTLDDDEWFDDVTGLIEFFQNGEWQNYNSGYYYVRNYQANGNYSMSVVGRMVRLEEGTCYEGKVHEGFNIVRPPHKEFSCFVHHKGYAFSDAESAKKHQERNLSILKKELLQDGGTPRLCAQMTQELIHLPETRDGGYRFAMDALQRNMDNDEWFEDPCAQWLLGATIRYFNYKKDYEGAKPQYDWIMANFKTSEMARLVIHGTMTNLAAEAQHYEGMYEHASEYLRVYDWQQSHKEEALLQTNLDMPKYKGDNYCQRIIYLGAAAANRLRKFEEAEVMWNRLPWGAEGFDGSDFEQERGITRAGLAETKRGKLIKSDIKLTIGMLVSNHIQYIRKTMESIKPILEQVSSELVVIDTVGDKTDGSIDVVKEYTDRIYPFTWCNDFSAARNFCLDHARGEWFMYLDDDEWFDNVQEFIDFFNSDECEKYMAGCYYTRDYMPDNTYSMGLAGRIIRRTEATRFEGRIHETFNEAFAPLRNFNCFTHHFGYYYANKEDDEAKMRRNVTLLEEEIREKGLNPQRAAQLVQELLGRDNSKDKGYQFCMESIKELEEKGYIRHSCTQWMLVASIRYFASCEEHEKVLEHAEYIQNTYYMSETAKLALAATAATAAKYLRKYELVLAYCDLYLELWDWRKENEQEAVEQSNLDFPRFYTESYYCSMVYNAAEAANHQGQYVLANKYWKRIAWKKEKGEEYKYFTEMEKTVKGLKLLQEKETRKAKLQECLVMFTSLQEANGFLQEIIYNGSSDELREYLISMQELAIALGTRLDAILGEGTEEVMILERYCEAIWQCNIEANYEKKVACCESMLDLIKKLKKLLC